MKTISQLKSQSLRILEDIALWKLMYCYDDLMLELKRGYKPSQLRIPSGNPRGGQWAREREIQVTEIFLLEEPPVILETVKPRPPIPEVIRPTETIRPPLEKYPTSKAEPPGPGYKWRTDKASKPGDKEGNWYKEDTKESLRPDLEHKLPKGPHWDYKSPKGNWRWYPDGRMEEKKVITVEDLGEIT